MAKENCYFPMPRARGSSGILPGICFLLFAMLLIFLCVACGGKSSDRRETAPNKRIAVSLIEANEAWVTDFMDGLISMAEENGMEVIYHAPKNHTSAWQMEDLEECLRSGISYLVLFPASKKGLDGILKKAREEDVRVILVTNKAAKYKDLDVGISIDYEGEGALCARILAEEFDGEEANIVEIRESTSSVISSLRSAGFEEELGKYPNLHIIEKGQGGGNAMSAKSVMEDIIRNRSDKVFHGIFSCSDEDGIGVLYALKLAGFRPGRDIRLVSVSGTQDVLKAIIAGEYTATVTSDRSLAITIMDRIREMEMDGKVSEKYVELGTEVFNSRNAESLLMEMEGREEEDDNILDGIKGHEMEGRKKGAET